MRVSYNCSFAMKPPNSGTPAIDAAARPAAAAVMGIVRRRTGSIRLAGEELTSLRTYQIARKGIAYCPEERAIFASKWRNTSNIGLPVVTIRSGGMPSRSR